MFDWFRNDRRRAPRIQHPPEAAVLQLQLGEELLPVTELSATGLKFRHAAPVRWLPATIITGMLCWPDGAKLAIEGRVLRIDNAGVILTFKTPLSTPRVPTTGKDRRIYFRLSYPSFARPSVQCASARYQVTEISERGIRILTQNLWVGQLFSGTIYFHDGHQEQIAGQVYRLSGPETVIRLKKGIPGTRVMAEQRYLLQFQGRPES